MDDPNFEVAPVDTQEEETVWNLVSKGVKRVREEDDTTINIEHSLFTNKQNFYNKLILERKETEEQRVITEEEQEEETKEQKSVTEDVNIIETRENELKGEINNKKNKRRRRSENDENILLETMYIEDGITNKKKQKEKKTTPVNGVKKRKVLNIVTLLDEKRRGSTLPEHTDRRKLWSKNKYPGKNNSTTTTNRTETCTKQGTPEEIDALTKLALRLQMNGIEISTLTEKDEQEQKQQDDVRTHHSRKKRIRTKLMKEEFIRRQSTTNKLNKENEVINMMNTIEIMSKVNDWKNRDWEEFSLFNVESELPIKGNQEKTKDGDVQPILYGKLKGVRAKILVDSGAKVTVMSRDFATANEIRKSTLHMPVKLSMANERNHRTGVP